MYTDLTPAGKAAVEQVLKENGIKAKLGRDYMPPGGRADCIKFKEVRCTNAAEWNLIHQLRGLGFEPDILNSCGTFVCDTAWIGAKALKGK